MSIEPPSPKPSIPTRFSTLAALRARLVSFSLGLIPAERHRLFALTIVLGGICGFTAVLFHSSIRATEALLIDRTLAGGDMVQIFGTIAVTTLGALVSGVLLHFFFPNARGSGIPEVKLIYAAKSGRMRLRDSVAKFFLSALQIGSGSSLGREGPTVQICAGAASAVGRLFAISPQNLRRLVPVGSAAGVAAAFNAPIAAVTFIVEEIIGDLDQTLLSGVVIAAALAAVIERSTLGEHPIFNVPREYGLEHASSLVIYAALGAAAALLAHAFYVSLLGLREYGRRRAGRFVWALPSVGGLVTGVLAVACIRWFHLYGVTGDGYESLSAALRGNVPLKGMLLLAGAKFVATVTCYATGGTGGLFAPVLFLGAMLGGCFAEVDRFVLLHSHVQVGAFALVGMGALFAAVIRAPITSVLIIFEMTGSYRLVLPLMIANSAAYMLARRLYSTPIYEALLEQDGHHLPASDRAATSLALFRVGDAMTTELVTLSAEATIAEAIARTRRVPYSTFPVLDENGRLIGLVSEARLSRRFASGQGKTRVAEHCRKLEYLREDELLLAAVARMHRLGARQMAVVSATDPGRLVGMLAMSDVMRAHMAAVAEPDAARIRSSHAPRAARRAVAWPRETIGNVPEPEPGGSADAPRDSDRPPRTPDESR